MSYRRRQKDLEKLQLIKSHTKIRNPIARDLHSAKYSQRVVKLKTKYLRDKYKENIDYE